MNGPHRQAVCAMIRAFGLDPDAVSQAHVIGDNVAFMHVSTHDTSRRPTPDGTGYEFTATVTEFNLSAAGG